MHNSGSTVAAKKNLRSVSVLRLRIVRKKTVVLYVQRRYALCACMRSTYVRMYASGSTFVPRHAGAEYRTTDIVIVHTYTYQMCGTMVSLIN